jgi:hypothetical protein
MLWVGPKYSDIAYSRNPFDKAITFLGPDARDNVSLCNVNNRRMNYSASDFNPIDFLEEHIGAELKRDSDTLCMFYNQIHSYYLPKVIQNSSVCVNLYALLRFLDTKSKARLWASEYIPIVPFEEKFGRLITRETVGSKNAIVQAAHSAGGYGTLLVRADDEGFPLNDEQVYMVSDYYERSVPVNINIMVFHDKIMLFPPSVQIIREHSKRLLYIGADYCAARQLGKTRLDQIAAYSETLGIQLQKKGYRGIVGFDYLVLKEETLFLEVNARFQASSFLLDEVLISQNLPSLPELNIQAFNGEPMPGVELSSIPLQKSALSYLKGMECNALLAEKRNAPHMSILWDGYVSNMPMEDMAYMFRTVFDTNICSVTSDFQARLHPSLLTHSDHLREKISNKEIVNLKMVLLNQGIHFSETAIEQLNNIGGFREATNSGVDITLENGLIVNCPINLKFSEFTPFEIHYDRDNNWKLLYYKKPLMNISVETDKESCLSTKQGTPFSSCSFFATDRVRLHHSDICMHKKGGYGCKFCDVPSVPKKFSMEDLYEIIEYYSGQPQVRHFLIGGGASPSDKESDRILSIVRCIRNHCSKNIYVMSLPPVKTEVLDQYHDAGVTEVAFNIEVFDQEIARKIMPGKGAIPMERYRKAFKRATQLWGAEGKVRSVIVAGLEPEESLLNGIEGLCTMGVQPILSPFRPMRNTPMEDESPPDNEWLLNLYYKASDICGLHGLKLGPDCPKCQNNTMSIPFL